MYIYVYTHFYEKETFPACRCSLIKVIKYRPHPGAVHSVNVQWALNEIDHLNGDYRKWTDRERNKL